MMQNMMKYMKSGMKPKEAIASAISDKRKVKMAQGGMVGDDDDAEVRGLDEIQEDGDMNPAAIASPGGLAEAMIRFAMGGMVGNKPAPAMNYGTEEPVSDMPEKPGGLEHSMEVAEGPGLSMEALEALKKKKKARMYGVYDPQ